jgi:hypothetical protein
MYDRLLKNLTNKQNFDPEIYNQLKSAIMSSFSTFLLGFRTLDSLINILAEIIQKFQDIFMPGSLNSSPEKERNYRE